MSKKKFYSGRGYIHGRYWGPKELYQYTWSLTEGLWEDDEQGLEERKEYHRFMAHIYVSMRFQEKKKQTKEKYGFIPLYSRLIEKEFGRSFDVHRLKDKGIIDIKPHKVSTHKTREYRLSEGVYLKAAYKENLGIKKAWERLIKQKTPIRNQVDLMTGEPGKVKREKNDQGLANIPKFIKEAIRVLKPCPFNPRIVGKLVNKLQRKYESEVRDYITCCGCYGKKHQKSLEAKGRMLTARGRYFNERSSQNAILNRYPTLAQTTTEKGKSLFEYKARYSIQTSGRISEIHGGFQNASKVFKRAFFLFVPEIYNYDLKSAQAAILNRELELSGLKSPWLESYINNSQAKYHYADKVGIPVGLWKDCFYALIMGAQAENQFGVIYKNIHNHFQDFSKAKKAFRAFLKVVNELRKVTAKWRDYIYRKDDRRYIYRHGGLKHWKNQCGMRFTEYGIKVSKGKDLLIERSTGKDVGSKPKIKEIQRRLAAFMLQGQEASFIHHMTIILTNAEIPIYKNEYDGLITGKKIPANLIAEAAEASGMFNPILELKPLCSEDKLKQSKEYLRGLYHGKREQERIRQGIWI